MPKGGYWGRLLEVDLTKGTVGKVPLPDDRTLRTWVGGIGLGLHMLFQRIRLDQKWDDPDTPVIVMTGPLTGTKASQSSDWKIITVNPELHYHPTVSQAHGYFGARLKHAGYDGIIITGVSPEPVYLWIDDDTVELRPAAKYWGKDTFETMRRIAVDNHDMERISVACIGPAGEREIAGASVRCDMAWGCNKISPGKSWGHKKLKAIAVRGTKQVPIADYEKFIEACEAHRQVLLGLPLSYAGTAISHMDLMAQRGIVPAMNFRDPEWQVAWGEQGNLDFAKWKVVQLGSWQCDNKCHYEAIITTGKFAGTKCIGYGAEVMEDGATNFGIFDPGTCVAMASFFDAMGADPGETGRLMAMCFEMYEKGLLTEADTGGLKLEWGNDDVVRDLFMKILDREPPLGNILAKSFRDACAELGRNSMDYLVHMKGVGFNGHDLRGYGPGVVLGELVSGAGPTWQGLGAESIAEPDLGYTAVLPAASPEGKAEAIYKTAVKKLWEDTSGLCFFATLTVPGISRILPNLINLATGFDLDWDEARLIGERIINLQRLYAKARGHKKADDLDVSARMLEPLLGGPKKGVWVGPHLPDMLDEYYDLLGWDVETGIPKPETLRRVGLEDYQIGREYAATRTIRPEEQ